MKYSQNLRSLHFLALFSYFGFISISSAVYSGPTNLSPLLRSTWYWLVRIPSQGNIVFTHAVRVIHPEGATNAGTNLQFFRVPHGIRNVNIQAHFMRQIFGCREQEHCSLQLESSGGNTDYRFSFSGHEFCIPVRGTADIVESSDRLTYPTQENLLQLSLLGFAGGVFTPWSILALAAWLSWRPLIHNFLHIIDNVLHQENPHVFIQSISGTEHHGLTGLQSHSGLIDNLALNSHVLFHRGLSLASLALFGRQRIVNPPPFDSTASVISTLMCNSPLNTVTSLSQENTDIVLAPHWSNNGFIGLVSHDLILRLFSALQENNETESSETQDASGN